ncbi:hypothetical protein [Geoglobus ahangari]
MKIEKCLDLLDKYVNELMEYIEYSNDILTVVKTHIRQALYVRLIKAKDSIPTRILKGLGLHPGEFVLKFEDAEKLIDMAILKTVDIMLKENQKNS